MWSLLVSLAPSGLLLAACLVGAPTGSAPADGLSGPVSPSVPMPDSPSLDAQLATFAEFGIRPADGVTAEALTDPASSPYTRADYEAEPYTALLYTLASERQDRETGERFSGDVWWMDAEMVDGPGTYLWVAEQVQGLAHGALPLTDLRDDVAWDDESSESGSAWLAFTLDGQPVRWEMEVDVDWLDMTVFDRFGELIAERSPETVLVTLGEGGQDSIFGVLRRDEIEAFTARTGIEVYPVGA